MDSVRTVGDTPRKPLFAVDDAHAELALQGELLAVAHDAHRDLLTGVVLERRDQRLPVGGRGAVDRDDGVAGLQPDLDRARRLTVGHLHHRGHGGRGHRLTVLEHGLALGQGDAEEDQVSDEEVRSDTGQDDQGLRPERLLPVGPALVLGLHLLERAHADDLDVGPERDRLDPVLGLTSLEGPDPGTEAQEELRDLHPGGLRGEVVARLVGHDEEDQSDEDGESTEHWCPSGSSGAEGTLTTQR